MKNLNQLKDEIKKSEDNEYILQTLQANEKLQGDKEVMLAAIKIDGQALYYASKELRADKQVVLEAVSRKGLILKYASNILRRDKEIVTAAIKQDKRAFEYISSDELKNDAEIKSLME